MYASIALRKIKKLITKVVQVSIDAVEKKRKGIERNILEVATRKCVKKV